MAERGLYDEGYYDDEADSRDEFDRHRNCVNCGRRLVFAQYDTDSSTVFTKRCPIYEAGNRHDFLEHRHDYPYHNRRGQRSDGTKARVSR